MQRNARSEERMPRLQKYVKLVKNMNYAKRKNVFLVINLEVVL